VAIRRCLLNLDRSHHSQTAQLQIHSSHTSDGNLHHQTLKQRDLGMLEYGLSIPIYPIRNQIKKVWTRRSKTNAE